jgi:hypothetical protein
MFISVLNKQIKKKKTPEQEKKERWFCLLEQF